MEKSDVIFVAGSKGLIASAVVRALRRRGFENLVGLGDEEPDCASPAELKAFFERADPRYVFATAGMSSGIGANIARPVDHMLDNLRIVAALIPAAHAHGVEKLLYLASSCSYPRDCRQPIREESLMTGPLEPTNDAYATARVAGIKLCQAYRDQYGANFVSVIPANTYGPDDDFDLAHAHVVSALVRKMHEAKRAGRGWVEVWGSGKPVRDFVYVDDVGDGIVHAMLHYDGREHVNVAAGRGTSVSELAEAVAETVGFHGEIRYDTSRPDGQPLKVLDAGRLAELGWRAQTPLREGLRRMYEWYLRSLDGPG